MWNTARRFALALFALLLLAAPARATWSIVIVDVRTGEVGVAIATCLTGFDLRPSTIVVVPGYGVAAAQSYVGGLNLRQAIRQGLLNGDSAAQILAQLAVLDPSHQTRQYGIVGIRGGEVTFTGTGAGAWAGGVTGQTGDFRYAIQGNVLTGQAVVTQCELAILGTAGTMGDKLMAGMQAARNFGGDGRCSCSSSNPTGCGAPPPTFTKSAHIALLIVSRPSDVDAPCNGALGCGAGEYWLDLNVANQSAAALDPVLQLQTRYNTWLGQQAGRPDHYRSTVTMSSNVLRADGRSTVRGTLILRDAQGNALGNALPASVQLAPESTASNISFSPVVAQANGSYEFTMSGNFDAGTAVLDVAVRDTLGRVGVHPRPRVLVEDLFGTCGAGAISNGNGGVFDALRINNSAGVDRVQEVGYAQPFTIDIDPPLGGSLALPVGLYALWAHVGAPVPGGELMLGTQSGSLCFTPQPFAATPSVLLADSIGLGSPIYALPAPASISIPGLPALLDLALQGILITDPQLSLGATNAVFLRVTALPPPVITSVTPLLIAPQQLVTVQGSNFLAGLSARVNGNPVAITRISSTQAQFVLPAQAACDASLSLSNPGSSATTALFNAAPAITSTPVTSGPASGGNLWFVAGRNLLGTTITFGGTPFQITSQTNTSIFGTVPPGTSGPVNVVVANTNGCQAVTTYTYL